MKNKSRRRSFIVVFILMFCILLFVEMQYVYLVSPIGLFFGEGMDFGLKLIQIYGILTLTVIKTKEEVIDSFYMNFGSLNNGIEHIVRITIDSIGVYFYLLSIFLYHKIELQEASQSMYLKSYIKNLGIVLFCLLLLLLLPFILLLRANACGITGSPYSIFIYFAVWLVPSVFFSYAVFFLLKSLIKEKILAYFAYVLAMMSTLNFKLESYPLYKPLVRFEGKDEAFYATHYLEIYENRLFILVVGVVLVVVTCFVRKWKQKTLDSYVT